MPTTTGRLGVGISLAFDGISSRLAAPRAGPMVPAARFRQWGGALAVVGISGAGLGLFRLLLGLAAIGLCRRRGDDGE